MQFHGSVARHANETPSPQSPFGRPSRSDRSTASGATCLPSRFERRSGPCAGAMRIRAGRTRMGRGKSLGAPHVQAMSGANGRSGGASSTGAAHLETRRRALDPLPTLRRVARNAMPWRRAIGRPSQTALCCPQRTSGQKDKVRMSATRERRRDRLWAILEAIRAIRDETATLIIEESASTPELWKHIRPFAHCATPSRPLARRCWRLTVGHRICAC